MRASCTLLVLAMAPVLAADPKPDFTAKAEEFAKEAKTDRKAFAAKYSGKTVEISGTVWMTIVPDDTLVLNGYKEKPTESVGEPVYCAVPIKLNEQLRGLARGQQVTIRGKVRAGMLPVLDECEFVKVGPSNAFPSTLSALGAEFKKNKQAADKKYDDRSVVVRVKVLDSKTEDRKVIWTVTEPAGKGTTQAKAWADPVLNKKFQEELERVKAGDILVLIAQAQSSGESFRLWNSVVLKEPPAGVKLPGDKK